MNMVTTCPSCLTRFVVKPEQLNSHHGKVRCSQCQHIFNADKYLNDGTTPSEFLAPTQSKSKHKRFASLIIALLVISALAQSLYFSSTIIANQWPSSKPTLTKLCGFLHCRVEFPKHVELIAIDDTDLVKDESQQNTVKFNCLLTNNAPYTQSFPLIELTLTDINDQPLSRRKITPKEYLSGAADKIKSGFAAAEETHVSLTLKTDDLPVAGFRAFVVYE